MPTDRAREKRVNKLLKENKKLFKRIKANSKKNISIERRRLSQYEVGSRQYDYALKRIALNKEIIRRAG